MSRKIGPEFVFPPKTSQRTLFLGTKYSPESTCLPFKFILGHFIEALEKGADTIAMITDRGPCRVGMYDVVMQQVLKDLGFKFDWIPMDDTRLWKDYLIRFDRERKKRGVSLWQSLQAIRFSWMKVRLSESVERMAHRMRPLERRRGETTRVQTDCLTWIDEASTFKDIRRGPSAEFREVPSNRERWVRLEVAARYVGTEGATLNGMAFTLYGGKATWDRAGKAASFTYDTDGDGLGDCLEDRNGDGVFDPGAGETDWQTSNSGMSGLGSLQVFTPLK